MSDRKGPFISQRAIHSFLPERQIGGIGPVGTGRLFAIASGRTLKVIHQKHFPFPKLSPAQLSWCHRDELAVSPCVSLAGRHPPAAPWAVNINLLHPATLLIQYDSWIHFQMNALLYHRSLYTVVLPHSVFSQCEKDASETILSRAQC